MRELSIIMKSTNKKSIVMRFYNIENALFRYKCTILAKFIYHLIQILFGCTIPYSAELHGVNIAHFHGIVIHHKTKVGEGTIIYQNVTLGGRNGEGGPVYFKERRYI